MSSTLWLAVDVTLTKGYRPESAAAITDYVNWDEAPDGVLQAGAIVVDRLAPLREAGWTVDKVTVRKT